jgi:hypothetical protein
VSAGLKQLDRDVTKREVCEYLLDVNRTHQGPFIPPTAIDWLGDGIVARIGRVVVKANRKAYFDDGDHPERYAKALEVVEAARLYTSGLINCPIDGIAAPANSLPVQLHLLRAALAAFDAVAEEDPSRSMKERQRIEESGA